MQDVRREALSAWARNVDIGTPVPTDSELKPASDDASFRRYFRFERGVPGVIFVDAPPEQEDNESFVKILSSLRRAGISCPDILAVDLQQGFMALTDLGDTLYLDVITESPARIPKLYEDATECLLTMLQVECELPAYDENLLRGEMSLFHEWFLFRQLEMTVTSEELGMIEETYSLLVDSALEQPVRFVHRDYHSRNLMVIEGQGPGVIDFQDAVMGPVTYDLVSLYKDCYYRFDRQLVLEKVEAFRRRLVAESIIDDAAPYLRWFDLMGAQRHLKCAGIFSRLNIRDGKPRYLGDIPLVVDYLLEVTGIYPELEPMHRWLRRKVLPRLAEPEFTRP